MLWGLGAMAAIGTAAQALDWGPCEPTLPAEASCATLSVPIDIVDPYRGTLPLAVARLPAPSQPARGQLWFVTGGPGDSGLDDLENIVGLRELVPDLDLVTFDHRGVGRSGRLSCPEAEAPGSLDGAEIHKDEWPACAAHVGETYAGELEWLTVTRAAVDLVLLTGALAEPGQEVYWWGVSYGTYLVQRALHLAPDGLDGVILDGLVPVDWTFLEFDQGLDTVARRWLAACGEDPDCASHFDMDIERLAEETLAALPARCERLGLDAPTSRLLTGVMMMPGEPYASLVPALWARLHRCAPRDRRAFVHLFGALFPEDGSGIAEKPGHSPVLQRHIAYADLWLADAPGPEVHRAALEEVISTTAVTASFSELYADWPVIPANEWLGTEPLWGRWPEIEIPVLALHGGFDPTMPIERVEGYRAWLDGPHQRLVEIPLAEHVTLNKGECPASLYQQFLTAPQEALDTSCIDEMPPYDWEGDPAFNEAILGTPDRFGERRCGCQSARGGAVGLWAGLLLLACGRIRQRASAA